MPQTGRHRRMRAAGKRRWRTIALSALAGFSLCVGIIIGLVVLVAPPAVQDPVPANAVMPPPHVDPKTTPEVIAYLNVLKREHLKPMPLDDLVTIGFGICVQRTDPRFNVSHATATLGLAASRKDLSKADAATIVNAADRYLCPR